MKGMTYLFGDFKSVKRLQSQNVRVSVYGTERGLVASRDHLERFFRVKCFVLKGTPE